MQLHDLTPAPGSKHARKRKGRGPGSGNGKTAGRGLNGQKSRSGGGKGNGFEGGQTPLARRLPKLPGFTNINRVEYAEVNVSTLNKFEDGAVVDIQTLLDEKVLKKTLGGVKILGRGELTKKLTVKANAFSETAKQKIEACGGTCEVI